MSSVFANRIVGCIALVLGMVVTIAGASMPFSFAGSIGPALIPVMVGIGWLLCGAYLVVRSAAVPEALDPLPSRDAALRIAMLIGIGAIHALILQHLSFMAAVGFLAFFGLWVVSDYGWLKRLIISVVLALGLGGLCIYVLEMPLPGPYL